jgi:hypothetical protein
MANSCPANVRETKIAFGFQPQADLSTPNTLVELWSLTKTNPALAIAEPVTEDNALDIGKGDEFPTQTFPSHINTTVPLEKYTSSEIMAHLFLFGLGKGTKTGAAPAFTYAAVPSDPVVNCINMAPFTWVEQIRTGADAVVDRALIGMCVNEFALTIESGPGRANSRVTAGFVGTGQFITPSAIVIPAQTPEHLLNASGTTSLNVNGIDYLLGGSFISAEFRWNNNIRLDTGIYPGSGQQNGFAIRGRMEYGTREATLTFVARAQKGSAEFTNLMSQTEGTTDIKIDGPLIGAGPGKHGIHLQFPRTVLSAAVNGEADGLVTVACTAKIMKPLGGGDLCTLSATTATDEIFGL